MDKYEFNIDKRASVDIILEKFTNLLKNSNISGPKYIEEVDQNITK